MNYIKTNHKWARQRGTTLIELSVVIAVLLLLVGVLFIGVTGWKNSANQAACILNIATVQKAMRSYQNANSLNATDPLVVATLTTAGYWTAPPACPSLGTYTFAGTVPAVGTAYLTCGLAGHVPKTTANW
jgi:prepilin-type N-terminal cleavage/methylation domain-containing protein